MHDSESCHVKLIQIRETVAYIQLVVVNKFVFGFWWSLSHIVTYLLDLMTLIVFRLRWLSGVLPTANTFLMGVLRGTFSIILAAEVFRIGDD